MLVYFENSKSQIAAKRNNKTQKLSYAVGEYYLGQTHIIVVTPVNHYGNQKSSGYGSGYHSLESFTDPPVIELFDDGIEKMEGLTSLKIQILTGERWIKRNILDGDWSQYNWLKFWFRSTVAYAQIRLTIYDSDGDYIYFNFTTNEIEETWKEFQLNLNSPHGQVGTFDRSNVWTIEFSGLPTGTHHIDDIRGNDIQILSLDFDHSNWSHPVTNFGPYVKPGIASTDEGVLVAAWIKKENIYTKVRICAQEAEVTSWVEGWSAPSTIHTALDVEMVCCLPAHGTEGVDIYFRAKAISDEEWHLYHIWTDAQGNYLGTEVIDISLLRENDWTACILGDGRKVILFKVENPLNSEAVGVMIKPPGSSWTGPFYLTTWIKMLGEGGYQWISWENVKFEDGFGLHTLFGNWNGGGADKDNIIHVLKMASKYYEYGTEDVGDIYFRINIDDLEARGEFPFSQMSIPWDHIHWDYEEALSVEYLTGTCHLWFAGDGGTYGVVYYAKKLPSQTEWGGYNLYWDGTWEKLGSTRDDFGGAISMIGNQWERKDDKLLRGSINTISCSITSDKNPYKQSQLDTEATFNRVITDSMGEEIEEEDIDEAYSKVTLPNLSETTFEDPFIFEPKMAINYVVHWSPSIGDYYLFWAGNQILPFKYLLPDLHPHPPELDHYELDGNTHVLKAIIHNQAHPYEAEDTDDAPGIFVCRFYDGNPDNGEGFPADPLPPGVEELGEVVVQGLNAGGQREIRVNLTLEGDPRPMNLHVAVDVLPSVNELTIHDELGEPLQTEKNNIIGNNVFLWGVLRLRVGHDKMVYIKTDKEVNFNGTVTDAFLTPLEGCTLTGQIKIPFQAVYKDTVPNPWTDLAGGNYSSKYTFQQDPKDPYGFYLYHVEAVKANYVPATQDGSFIYGKRISGNISVMPTPELDSVRKTDLIHLIEKFGGADGPLLVTGVEKRNFDAITFTLEEPEEDLADVIQTFTEEE